MTKTSGAFSMDSSFGDCGPLLRPLSGRVHHIALLQLKNLSSGFGILAVHVVIPPCAYKAVCNFWSLVFLWLLIRLLAKRQGPGGGERGSRKECETE